MSLTSPTIASSSAWVSRSKLVFLGRYRRILPFLFSLCLSSNKSACRDWGSARKIAHYQKN